MHVFLSTRVFPEGEFTSPQWLAGMAKPVRLARPLAADSARTKAGEDRRKEQHSIFRLTRTTH